MHKQLQVITFVQIFKMNVEFCAGNVTCTILKKWETSK